MTPMILKLVDPMPKKPVYLSSRWGVTSNQDEAFVFPSEVLARRYASAHLAKTGMTLMPVSSNGKASTLTGYACRQCGCTDTFGCPTGCAWKEPGLCSVCADHRELEMWVVYGPGEDYPDHYIARRTLDGIPTDTIVQAPTLEQLRAQHRGDSAIIQRASGDPVRIIETWL